jgi:hypothetical protein
VSVLGLLLLDHLLEELLGHLLGHILGLLILSFSFLLCRCRGSLTAGSKFLGLRVGPRTVAQTGGTQDLYWFRPPKSNTLRPVRVAVLFAMICSRGYKMGERGSLVPSLCSF